MELAIIITIMIKIIIIIITIIINQRGAKEGCCGTGDNLLIDRTVCQDSQRGKKEREHGMG